MYQQEVLALGGGPILVQKGTNSHIFGHQNYDTKKIKGPMDDNFDICIQKGTKYQNLVLMITTCAWMRWPQLLDTDVTALMWMFRLMSRVWGFCEGLWTYFPGTDSSQGEEIIAKTYEKNASYHCSSVNRILSSMHHYHYQSLGKPQQREAILTLMLVNADTWLMVIACDSATTNPLYFFVAKTAAGHFLHEPKCQSPAVFFFLHAISWLYLLVWS